MIISNERIKIVWERYEFVMNLPKTALLGSFLLQTQVVPITTKNVIKVLVFEISLWEIGYLISTMKNSIRLNSVI